MYVTAITVFTLKASKDYLFFMAQLERFALHSNFPQAMRQLLYFLKLAKSSS